MEDMELMMKIIVVGDGKVNQLSFIFILALDWKNMFGYQVRQKCFSNRVQKDFGIRFPLEEVLY